MAKYVTLFKYRSNVEGGGPARFAEVQEIVAAGGGKILAVYGLLGQYDVMGITEFGDTRSAMKAVAKVGNVIGASSQTMEALDGDDFVAMLAEL